MADEEVTLLNPYEVLGVLVDDDDERIKRAFRAKARVTHPDMHGGDREKYEEAVKAYRILLDPEMRSKYDKSGKIEKMSVEAIFSQAISMIAQYWIQVIEVCINSRQDPMLLDLVKVGIDHFKKNVVEIRQSQKEPQRMAYEFERTIKRLKRKDDGESLVHRALKEQLKQYYRVVENMEEQIDMIDQVLVILRDYEFTPDQVRQIVSGFNTSTGSNYFIG